MLQKGERGTLILEWSYWMQKNMRVFVRDKNCSTSHMDLNVQIDEKYLAFIKDSD